MMKLELDLPGFIRVIETTDYKGNPLLALLAGDTEVLYAEGHEVEGAGAEAWTDAFQQRFAYILAGLFLESLGGYSSAWSRESPTGRETWGSESNAHVVRLVPEEG